MTQINFEYEETSFDVIPGESKYRAELVKEKEKYKTTHKSLMFFWKICEGKYSGREVVQFIKIYPPSLEGTVFTKGEEIDRSKSRAKINQIKKIANKLGAKNTEELIGTFGIIKISAYETVSKTNGKTYQNNSVAWVEPIKEEGQSNVYSKPPFDDIAF